MILITAMQVHVETLCPYFMDASLWSVIGLGGGYVAGRMHCKWQDTKKEKKRG